METCNNSVYAAVVLEEEEEEPDYEIIRSQSVTASEHSMSLGGSQN